MGDSLDFASLVARLGSSDAAESEYLRLVSDIAGVVHPEIQTIVAPESSWGIIAFVGELDPDRGISVWQPLFGTDGFGADVSRRAQELLQLAIAGCKAHGRALRSWTLCLTGNLDDVAWKKWASWSKSKERETGAVIGVWTADAVRRRLLSNEGTPLREYYFPKTPQPQRDLQRLHDPERYTNALFVRQMEEAALPETYSAREAFFNAEILSREVEDKGIPAEIGALDSWRVRVQSTWSRLFNDACQQSPDRVPPGLYASVLDRIETQHGANADALRASVLHGIGIMHQAVDNSQAGWVRDWSRVAETHRRAGVDGARE